NGSAYPHSITVDMGAVRTIKRFGTLNSLYDGPEGDDRAPIKIQFLVSLDNITWTSLGEYSSNNTILTEQFYQTPAGATGRYFKLVGLQGPSGNSQYMVLGEVSAYLF
ncbi:MAG: discoidin domain-containing protein, partial [Pedobacter sp.]